MVLYNGNLWNFFCNNLDFIKLDYFLLFCINNCVNPPLKLLMEVNEALKVSSENVINFSFRTKFQNGLDNIVDHQILDINLVPSISFVFCFEDVTFEVRGHGKKETE